MEVHTFHGCVKKKYQLVEIYYKDIQNNTQPIVCYVHDSYIRHTPLDMTNYIMGRGKCAPFTLTGSLADPGDTQVSHAFESQGGGLVLCSASTNKLRTSDPTIMVYAHYVYFNISSQIIYKFIFLFFSIINTQFSCYNHFRTQNIPRKGKYKGSKGTNS